MNLVKERNYWRDRFSSGLKPVSKILADYRHQRYSEHWRSTRAVEELCEYILFLENRLESSSYVVKDSEVRIVSSMPKYAWKYTIGNVTINVEEDKTPCWFHRKMQELILGLKWTKLIKENDV